MHDPKANRTKQLKLGDLNAVPQLLSSVSGVRFIRLRFSWNQLTVISNHLFRGRDDFVDAEHGASIKAEEQGVICERLPKNEARNTNRH